MITFSPFSIGKDVCIVDVGLGLADDVVGVAVVDVVDVVLEVFRIITPSPPPKQQHEVSRS